MAQSLSGSRNTPALNNPRGSRVEHAGLASGETAYKGALMMMSGTAGTGNLLYLGSGSLSSYAVAGVVTEYFDPNQGTAASANGGNSKGLVVETGTFKFKNAGYEGATAATAADIGKLARIIDAQHVEVSSLTNIELSGSAIQVPTAPVAGRIVKVDSDGVWVDLTENTSLFGSL